MSVVNMNSIMSKLRVYSSTKEGRSKMSDKINEYVDAGIEKTNAGSNVTTDRDVYELAMELISDLQNAAAQACAIGEMPESVARHFDSLDIVAYSDKYDKELGMRFYHIEISFMDDMSRNSLLKTTAHAEGGSYGRYDAARTGTGINNIVALFEFGHMKPHESNVKGYWESQDVVVRAKTNRQGLGLIQGAIDNFNRRYDGANAWLNWKPEDFM